MIRGVDSVGGDGSGSVGGRRVAGAGADEAVLGIGSGNFKGVVGVGGAGVERECLMRRITKNSGDSGITNRGRE